jgi:hypothetical protein
MDKQLKRKRKRSEVEGLDSDTFRVKRLDHSEGSMIRYLEKL